MSSLCETRRWLPVDAPLQNGPEARSPELLRAVAAQFDVAHNPRYMPGPGKTWCNIFAADVLLALKTGGWLHWVETSRVLPDGTVDESHAGEPSPLLSPARAHDPQEPHVVTVEMTANDLCRWFAKYGADHGWTKTDRDLAGAAAARGLPVAVTYLNARAGVDVGPGHIAVLLPPVGTQLRIAQAGASNFYDGPLERGFGHLPVSFWLHS